MRPPRTCWCTQWPGPRLLQPRAVHRAALGICHGGAAPASPPTWPASARGRRSWPPGSRPPKRACGRPARPSALRPLRRGGVEAVRSAGRGQPPRHVAGARDIRATSNAPTPRRSCRIRGGSTTRSTHTCSVKARSPTTSSALPVVPSPVPRLSFRAAGEESQMLHRGRQDRHSRFLTPFGTAEMVWNEGRSTADWPPVRIHRRQAQ